MNGLPLTALDGNYSDRVRDARMRDITAATGQETNTYEIGASFDFTFGWLGPVLSRMAKLRTFALSLNQYNPVIMADANGPTQTLYPNMEGLLAACRIAAAGVAQKGLAQEVMNANGTTDTDLVMAPANVRSFGVRVTISNPPQSFPFGRIYVQLRDGADPLYQVAVEANVLPCSLILLGVNSAGGPASVIGIANPRVYVTNSGSTAFSNTRRSAVIPGSTWVQAETLNMRDIGVPVFQ